MARKSHTKGKNRVSYELINRAGGCSNFDRSFDHVRRNLNQDMETTRYIADILSVNNSRFYRRPEKSVLQHGDGILKGTTNKSSKEKPTDGSRDSSDLRSCIAFEKDGDEGLKRSLKGKSGESVKNLTKERKAGCPTCSGSESDLSRGRLTTKGKQQKNPTDMKLLMEAINNLENSDSVSSSSSKRPSHSKKNMTFTNEQLHQIDRENRILLSKIIERQKSRRKPESPPLYHRASSAINRMKKQMEINHNNQILLRKIQQAKATLPIKRAFTSKQYY